MAHYAFIDNNNIVTEVISGIDESELIDGKSPEEFYSVFRNQVCKRTSYNGNIRKNFAGIGFTYDSSRDAFIPPKPFDSWLLDEDTCQWLSPSQKPDNKNYFWDEENICWKAEEDK